MQTPACQSRRQAGLQGSFYVWGDPNMTVLIFINGKTYNVTANCHSAMLRLRETDETCLWIDAICINQTDDEEKSIQVALRRDVYYLAAEVIVWLGQSKALRQPDDEAKENQVIDLLDDLWRECFVDLAGFVRYIQQTQIPEICWGALRDLFDHVWTRGLWKYQEYTLAVHVKALLHYHAHLTDSPTSLIYWSQQCHDNVISRIRLVIKPSTQAFGRCSSAFSQELYSRSSYDRDARKWRNLTLYDVMLLTNSFECFDPRDRIFAVIGLCSKDANTQIRANYAQSLSRVYTNAAWVMIQETQSLDPLCFKRNEPILLLNNSTLPSWVQDWQFIYGGILSKQYNASLNTRSLVNLASDFIMLEAQGVLIDSIINCALNHQAPENIPKFAEWTSEAPGFTLWHGLFEAYPRSCDPIEAWIRTVTGDFAQKNDKSERMDQHLLQEIKRLFRKEDAGVEREKVLGSL